MALEVFASSSRILLHGLHGNPIGHGRGFRQGDPLSPLLFVIAIDPLQSILEQATIQGWLQRLARQGPRFRTSMYADDEAIFVAPTKEDVTALSRILIKFGHVAGLVTNFQKALLHRLDAMVSCWMTSWKGSRRGSPHSLSHISASRSLSRTSSALITFKPRYTWRWLIC